MLSHICSGCGTKIVARTSEGVAYMRGVHENNCDKIRERREASGE